jgi:hypothetical protein
VSVEAKARRFESPGTHGEPACVRLADAVLEMHGNLEVSVVVLTLEVERRSRVFVAIVELDDESRR